MQKQEIIIQIQDIIQNPRNKLEEEFIEAFERYMSTAKEILMSTMFGAMFGTSSESYGDLNDNIFIDYLTEYLNESEEVSEKFVELLEKNYKLKTVEGNAKFNADYLNSKKAGDEMILHTISEKCGRELNSIDIVKIQNAVEISEMYTSGEPTFIDENDNREDLCQKFIEFEKQLSNRLENNKQKTK